jgi:hypothetical protein
MLPVFSALALGPRPQRELTLTLRRGVAWPRQSVAAGAPVAFIRFLPIPPILPVPPILPIVRAEPRRPPCVSAAPAARRRRLQRGVMRPLASQGDGLFKHAVTKQVIEASLRDDLYSTAQKFFQLRDQPARKPWARIGPHVDEQIDVTLRPGIPTRHRAKHPDFSHAVPSSQPENLFSFRSYEVHHPTCSFERQCTVFCVLPYQAA